MKSKLEFIHVVSINDYQVTVGEYNELITIYLKSLNKELMRFKNVMLNVKEVGLYIQKIKKC